MARISSRPGNWVSLVALMVALLVGLAIVPAPLPADAAAPLEQRGERDDENDDDDDDDEEEDEEFTDDFRLDGCTFASTGKNTYFILEPGYQLVFEGREDGKRVGLTATVLDRTKRVAGVETRIVEERHTEDGVLIELSLNYFAICKETNSVIYFGEDVDNIENGVVVNNDGSWLAGVKGARAGLIMPGLPLLGARYSQEVAPGVALDRAEIESIDEVVRTPAGRFDQCLMTEETTPLEPSVKDVKFYAPGIGLVQDGPLKLVRHGRRP